MNNLQNILQTRCTFYAFLARIFRTEADQQLLEALNGYLISREIGRPRSGCRLRSTHALGKQRLAAIRSQNLPVDYARVFLGAGVAGKRRSLSV